MMNMRNKKNKRIIAAIIAILLALAMVLPFLLSASAAETGDYSGAGKANDFSNSSTVKNGVTIEGVDVSGMDRQQVQETVDGMIRDMRNAIVTMHGRSDDQTVTVQAGNLGLKWSNTEMVDEIMKLGHAPNIIARYKESKDLEKNGAAYHIDLDFDRDMIRRFIEVNCTVYNTAPEEARLRRENGTFVVTGGATGYAVDESGSADSFYSFLKDEWAGKDIDLSLEFIKKEPRNKAEDLVRVRDLLGTYTTNYSSSNSERSSNIANGCRLIDGSVVAPGEEFSVLWHITPFTEANGYKLAGSYLGDEVVDSLGGGICQVSTTLYNALIRAELQITARSNHSMIVGYVQPSEDAAIAESAGMDLKFVNNLDYPVYIEGLIWNKSITFNVYGVETRPAGRRVSFESETLEVIPTEGSRVKRDPEKDVGYVSAAYGHTGYKAQLWKIITGSDGQVSRELFNKSTYNMTPMIITVGTRGTVTQELEAAISANNLSQIQTAAANAKAAMQPAEPPAQAGQEAAPQEGGAPAEAGEGTQPAEGIETIINESDFVTN